MSLITTLPAAPVQDQSIWDVVSGYGLGAAEYLAETAGGIFDTWTQFKVQEFSERYSSPDVVRDYEPVKGERTDGTPIPTRTNVNGEQLPTSGGSFTINTNTALIVGGIVLGAVLLARK